MDQTNMPVDGKRLKSLILRPLTWRDPLSLSIQVSVGKKYAIYLPRAIVRALNLKEGEKVLLRVSGATVILESLQDPIHLALSGRKFASLTQEQVEKISAEEQATHFTNSP